MDEKDFNRLKESLNQAKEYVDGKRKLRKTTRRKKIFIAPPQFDAVMIKAIRKKAELSQNDLADALGVGKKTVQAWEAKRNTPGGAAARLLSMINDNPRVVDSFLRH